jgi:hypothetical protein
MYYCYSFRRKDYILDDQHIENSLFSKCQSYFNSIEDISIHRAGCQLEQVQLLTALCPRIKYLQFTNTKDIKINDSELVIRFLLNKQNQNTRQLCSLLYFRHNSIDQFQGLKTLIKSERLLDDYI